MDIKHKIIVLLDNGHGDNTLGKCSPDKALYEYLWTRDIVARVADMLQRNGVDARVLVPEKWDVSLGERVRRANAICSRYGSKNVCLASVHVNASGSDGKWHDARGFQVYVAKSCSAKSKKLAQLMYAEAEQRNLKGNRWVPAEKYWQANYYILKSTNCPAVLTENLFQDNKEDVRYLLGAAGKKAIADLHVNAIMNYIKIYE